MNLSQNRKLNWRPSKPDFRNWKYEVHPEAKRPNITFPPLIDLRPKQSPVWDQGNWGSCTGFSTKSAEEYLQLLDLRDQIVTPEEFDPKNFDPVSGAMLYADARIIEGDVTQDNGAEIHDVVKGLRSKGVCREVTWPYIDANILVTPSQAAYNEASNHKLRYYYHITDGNLDQMKRCLIHGYPFLIGFTVYDSFMTDAVAATGIVPMPKQTESVQGGHAVMACGYDDMHSWFIVKNSWSTGWGDRGYFYMPYAYFGNVNLAGDVWTLRRTKS